MTAMLAEGASSKTSIVTVEPLRFIHSGIAASAVAHLSILAMIMIFAEVHPLGSVTAEPITVDIISPEDAPPAPKTEEPPPPEPTKPSDVFDLSPKSAPAPAPAAPQPAAAQQPPAAKQQPAAKPQPAAKQQAAAQPQQQQAPAQPQQQAALSPPPDAQPATAEPQQPPPASASPGFAPPEPDLTVKYGVMLGLPQELPAEAGNYNFDSAAAKTADVASGIVTEFRQRLRTCSKLPPSIDPSNKITIKLRVLMTRDGKLAADPILIEASASPKGPALMQSAISALQACQPYAMLPADRYSEWRALDLSFTPQDFGGG